MRRLITLCLLALSAVALLATAPMASAAKKGPKPQITRVTPMRISVGNVLVIRGRHFRSPAKRNTVIFRAGNGRTAFAKPRRASATKLVVRVPAAAARLLTVEEQPPAAHAPQAARARRQVQRLHDAPALAGRDRGRRRRRRQRRREPRGLHRRHRPRRRPAVELARAVDQDRSLPARHRQGRDRGRLRVPVGARPQPLSGEPAAALPGQAPVPERARPERSRTRTTTATA